MPSDPPHAVFLSYSRDDTKAARGIADALRAFGLEVWFDQNELRGGDVWDQKIRRQIKECALFLPIISASTQARGEGYFRREWKLAVERTNDMAAGLAFIVPVVVDETAENEAAVPEEFLRYQWTRLPPEVPLSQFAEQVRRLLETPRRPSMEAGSLRPDRRDENASSPGTGQSGRRLLPIVAVGLVVLAVATSSYLLRNPAPAPPPASSNVMSVATPASAKSIAVLPFANMSEDRDGNAFFSDGIHEDILTNLALIRELHVVSRTSVLQYRVTTKPIRQIARELGVAYILEGSVRRAGHTVRVTGQLIDARTDEHVWAKSYDRDLSDVFAIQSELAQAIATALQAALSPQEKTLIGRRPTDNPAAYDRYLKARPMAVGGAGADGDRATAPGSGAA
jgi:TolB-like protein